MSESSEEKTIRKIKSSIIKYQAYNQTSLMIINYEDCSCMFEVFTEIRKAFSAMFADVTLVWWLRLIYVDSAIIEGVDVGKKRVEVPMIQIHSPTKLDIKRIREFIEKKFDEKYDFSKASYKKKAVKDFVEFHPELNTTEKKIGKHFSDILLPDDWQD